MNGIRPYKIVLDFLMEIINRESFEANYKLPSERMLAIKFDASRRSIRMAYDTLIGQGLVTKVHGKGYFTTGRLKSDNTTNQLTVKQISFIVPALRTQFVQDILYGITDFCDKHAMDVSIKFSKGNLAKEAQYINSAFSSNVKGIILFPTDNELLNHELFKLSAARYPISIIDRYFKNINSSFISTNNYNAMLDAVKFLHAKKHKNFLYLTPPISLATSVEERLNGYLAGIKHYYGNESKDSVVTLTNFDFQKVYNCVVEHLREHPETEVIITNGVHPITDAVIAAVKASKRSIPKDIRLMIFDNDFSATEINLIRPYVIQQDAYQIGYQSAATLYNQIYGDLRTQTIRLPIHILDYTKKELLQSLLG